MEKDTLLNRLTEIGTCEDETTRRTILAEVMEETRSLYDRNEALQTANNDLTVKNEKLREANTDLFLQIGSEKKPDDLAPTEPEPEKRKFENLFNDKGELK
jgi:hypothetical protein